MPREKVSARRSLHERPTLSIYVKASPSPSLRVDSVEPYPLLKASTKFIPSPWPPLSSSASALFQASSMFPGASRGFVAIM